MSLAFDILTMEIICMYQRQCKNTRFS